jgi:hypothetical protein
LDQRTINQVDSQIKQMESTLPITVRSNLASPNLGYVSNGPRPHMPLGVQASMTSSPNLLQFGTNPSLTSLTATLPSGFTTLQNTLGLGFSMQNTLPSTLPAHLSGVLGVAHFPPLHQPLSNSTDAPKIPLTQKDISKTYPNIYYHLYERNELQCKQCGIRFEMYPNGKQDLQEHLDWHFRQKRKQKERNSACSRDWYHSMNDWIHEQPIEPTDQSNDSLIRRA